VQPAPPRVGAGGRRPKPKARELNKRDMDEEEKQKLRVEIESLPEEKMVNVLQIVQKRNSDPALTGEVVELDFDELDTETLWELDRFVVNWRKALKKSQRNSVMNGDVAAMNGDAIDVTVVAPDEEDMDHMVQVDANPPMLETGDSVMGCRSNVAGFCSESICGLCMYCVLLLLIMFLLLVLGD